MKEKIKQIITGITLEKAIKISMVLAVLLISSAVFYHYVVFLPQKEQRIELQPETQINSFLLESCLEVAEKKAENETNNYIKSIIGTKTSTETIQWSLDKITQRLHREIDECYKKYPTQ